MKADPEVLRGLADDAECRELTDLIAETIALARQHGTEKVVISGSPANWDLILAALRAPQNDVAAPSEWRLIKTAPKDGTKVLLRFAPPFHDRLESGLVTGLWTNDVWWLSSIWASTVAHKDPTHWQPLPFAQPYPSPQNHGGNDGA